MADLTEEEREQLAKDAGQMVFGSAYRSSKGTVPGKVLPVEEDVTSALELGHLGGVLVFPWNLIDLRTESGMVVPRLLAAKLAGYIQLATSKGHPVPFLSIDQEGGEVQRLGPDTMDGTRPVKTAVSRIPSARNVGAALIGADGAVDVDRATRIGIAMASELRAFGFNLDFAPVTDLGTRPSMMAASRAYSADAAQVTTLAGAICAGMNAEHIIPCIKHFPGHGAADGDSHHFKVTLPFSVADALSNQHLTPFRELSKLDPIMVMVGHLFLTGQDKPATLAPEVVSLLRTGLGYQGVIITDDLWMDSARFTVTSGTAFRDKNDVPLGPERSVAEVVRLGVEAGIDVFLSQDNWIAVHAALVELGTADAAIRAKIIASADRVRTLKKEKIPAYAFDDVIAANLADAIAALKTRHDGNEFYGMIVR